MRQHPQVLRFLAQEIANFDPNLGRAFTSGKMFELLREFWLGCRQRMTFHLGKTALQEVTND